MNFDISREGCDHDGGGDLLFDCPSDDDALLRRRDVDGAYDVEKGGTWPMVDKLMNNLMSTISTMSTFCKETK